LTLGLRRTRMPASVNTRSISRALYAGVLVCFFVSGAAGLVYQVAWGKALGLVFGHTAYAIATVLAVFMGGLALGSAWLGRWSERSRDPIALYGAIELGVAVTGAMSLAGLAGVRALYVAAYPVVSGSTPALLLLRFLGSAIVLLLPTFLMGGTLPVLAGGLTRRSEELGARLSRLYWVNTAGAVAGTLVAGFVFLPALGLKQTVAIAVSLNFLAGCGAILLSRTRAARTLLEPTSAASPPPEVLAAENGLSASSHASLFLALTFGAVGGTAMAYEIGWTRMLAIMLGSSTYAFTLMLAVFLAGIVLGSALFELAQKWLRRRPNFPTVSSYALTQSLTACGALLFLTFFLQLPRVIPPILRATHESFRGLVVAQFVTYALAMLPAAVVFGFNFPLVTLLFAGRDPGTSRHSAAVGRAYAANTLGAIVGAVLTGFWLMPKLGTFRVVALAAGINIVLALALDFTSDAPGPRRVLGGGLNLALAAVVIAAWSGAFYDRTLATFGTVLYWDLYEGKLSVAETAATTDIPYAVDGLNSSVSVARTEDYIALRNNGKVDASNRDSTTQLLVGHLAPIFHAAPRHVLIIGFGSGMTVSAVARYPEIERIDCVEIEPAVIGAAPYLESLNRGVLRDPRVHIILDDARNFLLTTRDSYDVIISEPSNPWIAGVAALFTEEYYRAALHRLRPGGLFVQWVQAYSLYPEDLRMVLATFVPQFPQVTLWHGDSPDLLLLARPQPLSAEQERAAWRLERFRTLWNVPQLREDYESLGMRDPLGLYGFYLLEDAELRQLAADRQRNTDDRTLLEYRAPRALLAHHLEDKNREIVLQFQKSILPAALPEDLRVPALEAAAETMINLDERETAERYLSPLLAEPLTARRELLRGRLYLADSRYNSAKVAYTAALHLDPSSIEASCGLAEVARHRAEYSTGELLLNQILLRRPDYLPAIESLYKLARDRQDWKQAVVWQLRRIAADPKPSADQFAHLGEAYLFDGELAASEAAFQKALAIEPYAYSAHRNLGQIYFQQKNWEAARKQLEFVVRYFPDGDSGMYLSLAALYRMNGDARAADAILRKGLRVFPGDADLKRAVTAQ
jgi:spermidine synthase